MSTELELFAAQVVAAKRPEDLFGTLVGGTALQVASVLYKRFALIAHEDRYLDPAEKLVAHEAFTTLNRLWTQCRQRIAAGTYGTHTVIGTVASKTETYELLDVVGVGETSTVYLAQPLKGAPVLVKVALQASVNPLLARETSALAEIRKVCVVPVKAFLPEVRAEFLVKQSGGARRVTVFDYDSAFIPLPEILRQHPTGLDPRHAVWIFKRLLAVLASAHEAGVLHGAVTPDHILVRPKDHAIRVVGWTLSIPDANPLQVISGKWREWYPPEVLAKRVASPAVDLYMAAEIVNYVLGSTPLVIPPVLDAHFRRVVRPCLLGNPVYRPTSAWAVHDAFDLAAKRVFGPPMFVPLTVAAKGV